MQMISWLLNFSQDKCILICATLVPANLLATTQTLIFTGLGYRQSLRRIIVSMASIYAVLLMLHVMAWLWVGVVRIPTFVLLCMGSLCLSINAYALARPKLFNKIALQLGVVGQGTVKR